MTSGHSAAHDLGHDGAPVGPSNARSAEPVDWQARRAARERAGRRAEWAAATRLVLVGYRILARRARTRRGEIDLIAVRGRRIVFVEVKYRSDETDIAVAIRPRQTARLHAAAASWIAAHPAYRDHVRGFDAVFVTPWRWPQHVVDGLQPDLCVRAAVWG